MKPQNASEPCPGGCQYGCPRVFPADKPPDVRGKIRTSVPLFSVKWDHSLTDEFELPKIHISRILRFSRLFSRFLRVSRDVRVDVPPDIRTDILPDIRRLPIP